MDHSVIRRVKEEVSIAEVVSDHLTLRKSGRSLLAICPFHPEKTPSFSVNEEKGFFHCFGCHEKGDAITFLMKIEGKTFVEAVHSLARRAGIPVTESPADRERADRDRGLFRLNLAAARFFERCLGSGENAGRARKYLAGRGLSPAALETFRLGYAPGRGEIEKALVAEGFSPAEINSASLRFSGRLVFPIFNLSGECAGFGGRALDDSQPKYINSPENGVFRKGHLLYGLNACRDSIRERDRVILVEGYLDLIKAWQAGITNVAAGLGTSLTREQASLIGRFTRRVTLLYDSDEAGLKAAERNLEPLFEADLEVRVAALPGGHDPDSFIDAHGAGALGEILEKSREALDFRIERALERHPGRDARIEAAREIVPLIEALPAPLRKSAYLVHAAQALGLPEDGLRAEVARAGRRARPRKREEKPAAAADPRRGVRLAEQIVLGCALQCPETRREALREIDRDRLVCPDHAVICSLLEQLGEGDALDQARAARPEMSRLLEEVCRLAEEYEPDALARRGNCRQYLDTIAGFQLREKIRAAREKSVAKEGEPDLEALSRLQEMILSRHRERPGNGNS